MPELEPQQGKYNLIRRIGERVGIIETHEQKEVKNKLFQEEIERRSKEMIQKAHILANHSDACLSEIEYILGITNRDPHPNHTVTFTKCEHQK